MILSWKDSIVHKKIWQGHSRRKTLKLHEQKWARSDGYQAANELTRATGFCARMKTAI